MKCKNLQAMPPTYRDLRRHAARRVERSRPLVEEKQNEGRVSGDRDCCCQRLGLSCGVQWFRAATKNEPLPIELCLTVPDQYQIHRIPHLLGSLISLSLSLQF